MLPLTRTGRVVVSHPCSLHQLPFRYWTEQWNTVGAFLNDRSLTSKREHRPIRGFEYRLVAYRNLRSTRFGSARSSH